MAEPRRHQSLHQSFNDLPLSTAPLTKEQRDAMNNILDDQLNFFGNNSTYQEGMHGYYSNSSTRLQSYMNGTDVLEPTPKVQSNLKI